MAGKLYLIDKSGVVFYSDGTAKIGGLVVNVNKPEKLNVLNTTIDLFRHTPIPVTNSVYNRIGYGIVASQNTGGEVLYPIQKLRDGIQPTDTNNSRFNYDMYSIRRNEGIKLESYYFVRGTKGNICGIQAKSSNNSVVTTPSGEKVPIRDYYFYFSGKAESVKNRGTWFSSWKLTPIEKKEEKVSDDKTYNGGSLPEITAIAQVPGMPSNFSKNTDNVKILQQYLVRMGEQKNIATRKVPSGVDGKFGYRTAAVTAKVMRAQKWTWDQLWANAVKYAQQTNGQSSPVSNGAVQTASNQLNPEASQFANPTKLTAQATGINTQPVSAANAIQKLATQQVSENKLVDVLANALIGEFKKQRK